MATVSTSPCSAVRVATRSSSKSQVRLFGSPVRLSRRARSASNADCCSTSEISISAPQRINRMTAMDTTAKIRAPEPTSLHTEKASSVGAVKAATAMAVSRNLVR